MEATQTTSSQYLAFEHPFHSSFLLFIGIACAVAMLWTLYRERKVLGRKTTLGFTVLRAVAVAIVFWMLMAPTTVLEEATTTRKAIAILTDISASMTTVDPVGTADDARWASTQSVSPDDPINQRVVSADRAIAALGLAHRELSAAVADLEKHGAEHQVAEHIQSANNGIGRAKQHLFELRDPDPIQTQRFLRRLLDLIDSPEYESLSELAATFERGRTPAEAGWREGLPDLIGRTATSRRVFRELADQLATDAEAAPRGETSVAEQAFQNQPRSERVAAFLEQLQQTTLSSLDETADVQWSSFDDSSQDLTSGSATVAYLTELSDRDDVVKQTDFSTALQHVDRIRQDRPVAATLVFTDVAHNHAGERKPAEIAAQMDDTPIYVIPIGNQSRLRDVDLVATSAPSVAMRNDDVVIEAQLEIYQCMGESFVVQLLRDGEVIDFRNVPVDSDSASRTVRFDQRVSEVGTASFQLAVEPVDGEMTTENNFDEIEINVTRSDIKVLLADEHPRWEYRYLSQLFRRDPKVDVDELLYHPRLIATGRRENTGTFPITVDAWDQYDVVILGDLTTDHFPSAAQESLLQYLRTRGGTLILIAGDRAMPHAYVDHPLHDAIPVKPTESDDAESGYAFQVTKQGESHVALMIGETEQSTREAWDFVNRFSPLHKVSRWRTPLPTALSLIAAKPRSDQSTTDENDASNSTFLCWQPVGRGRVIYLSSPDTYRLRFLRGDQLHYRFWGQLMRWAIASDLSSGNQLVRIRTGKTLYQTDQSIDVEVELLDSEGTPVVVQDTSLDAFHLRLIAGDQEQMIPLLADEDRPGHYQAEIRSLAPGVYQAQPSGLFIESMLSDAADLAIDQGAAPIDEDVSATFTVQADLPSELIDTRSNRVLAAQVAELTGGQVLPPTAVAEVLELTNLDPIVTHRVQRQPLWLRWRYLWLVFGCLQAEWIIRKWRGLS